MEQARGPAHRTQLREAFGAAWRFVDVFGEGGGYYDPKPYKPKIVGLLVLPKTFILGKIFFP